MVADGEHPGKTFTSAPVGKRGRSLHTARAGAAMGVRETEKGFLQAIRDLARVMGWEEYHTHLSLHSSPGFPDLVLVRPPYVIFVEVKSSIGRVSPAQQRWIELLQRCPGVSVYLWRPCDWRTIVERLSCPM
jgi:hypothetical protein